MKNQTIQWVPKLVNVKDIKPTPNNYKIKTDLGKERLQTSLKLFGLAGTVIVNTDMTLIDGNSRLLEAVAKGDKKIYASMPTRKLTPKEFNEMSAMYDYAKAGDVDIDRIKKEQGKAEDFYKRWGMEVPMELLAGMGASVKVDRTGGKIEYPAGNTDKAIPVNDIRMVQLFFSAQEEEQFRVIEEVLKKRFKTSDTTTTVLKAFKFLKK